ncbi:hypothetical protein [Mumia sp. DW29H23]|uniref:hypothetical protein n=1 Tax=Mumia sp. DW29H23 TaxID=3421241 RepID=UPI003D69EE08
MPGPAPKHPSVRARRNDPKSGFVTLPSKGREGDAPPWPLKPDNALIVEHRVAVSMVERIEVALDQETDGRKRRRLTKDLEAAEVKAETLQSQIEGQAEAELEVWRELWATPQAVEWERTHAFRAVAMFVRWSVKAEGGNLDATKEARMWSDRLGLNPLALHKLRQEVEQGDAAEEKGDERRKRRAQKKAPAASDRPDPRAALHVVS